MEYTLHIKSKNKFELRMNDEVVDHCARYKNNEKLGEKVLHGLIQEWIEEDYEFNYSARVQGWKIIIK